MRMFKQISVVLLIIYCQVSIGQNIAVDKEIQKIDTLIEYNQYDKARKKADSLYQVLVKINRGEVLEQRLEVRLQQGIIFDNQFEHKKALEIFLEVAQKAETNNLYRILCISYIKIALQQEKTDNFYLAYDYIKAARKIADKYKFTDLYSKIYIRYSFLHRYIGDVEDTNVNQGLNQRLLDKGFIGSIDSAVYYADKSIEYATMFNNVSDLKDGYLTLGSLYGKNRKNNVSLSTEYFLKALRYDKKLNNTENIGALYRNIAVNYLISGDFNTALKYNDSSYMSYDNVNLFYKYIIPQNRADIFEAMGKTDSAYHYLKIAYVDVVEKYNLEEVGETKKLEEQFQNDKKEAIIKNKNQLLIFILILVIVIAGASVLLILKNRKINTQNKTINKQLEELVTTLDQKQVLLSELQHRVKNNLQHVISILEIQKESIDFNNIDEVIRSNQNRIHSMALLHKKLNISESVNDIDLKRYVTELSELVKESYDTYNKKIQLNISCEVENITIENALPTGLIIVELLSNSIKHAFKDRAVGIITIAITKDESTQKTQLYYADNGNGFDFNTTSKKGLGLEIIVGLIDQLNGEIDSKNNAGFEITISF
ncbi:sensor histidine kinase [Aequorivita lipolytica]|nr:sensor histidine kinase [Aequorivita lipolytica]